MTKVFHFHERPQRGRVELIVSAQRAEPSLSRRIWGERRVAIYVVAVALIVLIVLVGLARAGGPQYVAGISYFNAGLAGQPVTWAGGAINYYTDQGNLSPILPATGATLQFELPMLSVMAPSPGRSTGKARAPVRLNARLNRGGERPNSNPQRLEDLSRETRLWNWSLPVETTNYNVDCVPMAPKSDANESEPSEPKTSAKSALHPAGPDQACDPGLSDVATQE